MIGIGNPGAEYAQTYHNVGALFVSHLAGEDATWTARDHVRYVLRGETAYALTSDFMNESGRGVAELLRFLKIEPRNVIVAHDDTDQLLGNVRVRAGGGSGGQKGVASIIEALGTDAFWRLKIGARPEQLAEPVRVKAGSFVLSRIAAEDRETLYGVVFDKGAKLVSNVIENEMPSGPALTSVTGS